MLFFKLFANLINKMYFLSFFFLLNLLYSIAMYKVAIQNIYILIQKMIGCSINIPFLFSLNFQQNKQQQLTEKYDKA